MNKRVAKRKIQRNFKNEGVIVTTGLILHWFHFFNSLIFGGGMGTPEIKIWRMRGYEGEFYARKVGRIGINSNIKNKELLISTIAHEMAHQYQWEMGKKLSHSGIFLTLKKKFKEYGVKI